MDRRGQGITLTSLVSVVVILAVVIVATSLLASVIHDTRTTQDSIARNENFTTAAAARQNHTFLGQPVDGIISVVNVSTGVAIPNSLAGYYLYNQNSIIEINTTAGALGNSNINVTYTNPGDAKNISTQGLTALSNVSSQIPNIGTIIAIVLIITLLAGAVLIVRG